MPENLEDRLIKIENMISQIVQHIGADMVVVPAQSEQLLLIPNSVFEEADEANAAMLAENALQDAVDNSTK